ncbi:peptidase [Actinomadura kijaniata]|uniref:V8-like Glu-specific endopeptidase n=1 Tax=Actinomadura namibiensis TaxID=182080 RepID=A0A7W3QJJ9_ACTNM|nr:peptidase [Actinomadura namibiensis]MBA8949450.1 V8-like Glu-specific endopeptidase [Actinomadura namibiensis]
MTRSLARPTRTLALAVLGGAALAAPLFTAPAHAAPAPSPTPSARAQATDAAEQRRVLRFWTAERMRSATPMEKLFKPRNVTRSEVRRGLAKVVPPVSVRSIPNGGSQWTGGGRVVTTAGRVFFTYQGRTASCSGDAVTSANKSTVMTAGHCVKLEGSWHTNWVFVPGYDNGNRPHGTWTAARTLATPQWTATEDINYDVGAAVVNPLNGQRLTDVVGAQGIAFNQPRGQNMYAFGYPAAAPYDGSRLIYCSGRTINDFLGSQAMGLRCNMTGGSSGGPWFLNFNEGTGTGVQNSVNSFKYNLPFLNAYMFGPYFGTDAQNVYNQAQNS